MKFPVLFCLLALPAALFAEAPPELAPAPLTKPSGSPVNRPKPVAVMTPKPEPAPPAPASVDALSADAVKKALSALHSNYVAPISEEQMSRATLQGLLDSLSPSVSLSGSGEKPIPDAPFYSEVYENRVGYLRLGALSAQNLEKAGTTLADWQAKKIGAVILDLRSTSPSSDFGSVASLARLFCTDFTLKLSNGAKLETNSATPPFGGLVVVLVDGGTAQAAEAAAAVLRESAKAILVGDTTSGKACEFKDIPLEKGMVLHVAAARAETAKGALSGGLKPDISEGRGASGKEEIMREITAHGVARVVTERGRAHLNEAALVAGRDPDIDTLEADQKASHQPPGGAVHVIDKQLQRALDLVTSISVFQAKKTPAVDALGGE